MKDFTLAAFRKYLSAINLSYPVVLRVDDYLSSDQKPKSFCIIRHDVDRNPYRALRMAAVEQSMSIQATYYFRVKSHTFRPKIIQDIHGMGHEIGYHYECLSDHRGDIGKAIEDFNWNLRRLRKLAPIKTVAMHGTPFSDIDNRDLWSGNQQRKDLKDRFNILGEVYLDIDYSDILYINDTGRNWISDRANRRDKVSSKQTKNFRNGSSLLTYLKNNPHPKMVFQIHPERWSDSGLEWIIRSLYDQTANFIKYLFAATKA